MILKETFKDRDSVHKQLLKSELGPGSVEIDGRIKKSFLVTLSKYSTVLIQACLMALFWVGVLLEISGPSFGFDTLRYFLQHVL